jgi:mono/diheme cytochrome c family protein
MAGVLPEKAMAGRAVGDFTLNCSGSGCHGSIQNPSNGALNASATSISSNINNENRMRFLSFLTKAQIDDIAVQLGRASSCSSSQVWNPAGLACQPIPVCASLKILSADKTSCVTPDFTCNFSQYFNNEAITPCINSRVTVTALSKGSYDNTAIGSYDNSCSGCHGSVTNPTRSGVNISRSTIAQIQGAINSNAGGVMGGLILTPAQIDDIAKQLGSVSVCALPKMWDPTSRVCTASNTLKCTASQIPNADGSACISIKSDLYTTNCASCHGYGIPNKTGVNISNTSVAKIQTAIQTTSYGMGYLGTLTTQQLNDIVNILAVTCSASTFFDPTSNSCVATAPPGNFTNSCSTCHGDVTLPNKTGVNISNSSVSKIQAAIATTSYGMGSLSSLSTTQLTDIANQLAVICLAPQVFNSTGNSCTSPTAISCTAPQVPNAENTACIRVVGDYNTSCVGCHSTNASDHGTDVATSQKKPRTAAQIQAAIDATFFGMNIPSLTSLTPAQVDDIAIQLGAATTCAAPQTWDANGSICGAPPVICTLPEIRNTLTNKCVVAITKAGVVGVAGTAAAGTDVYKVTCGKGTLSLLAAIQDNIKISKVPTISIQIIKHPHASIPAIDSVDDSNYSSLIRLAGGLGPYTVTVNKEQYIGTDLLNKGIEDYTNSDHNKVNAVIKSFCWSTAVKCLKSTLKR